MSEFFSHYGIQPGVGRKFDNFIVLERRQLLNHAARRWPEDDPDEILRARKTPRIRFGTEYTGVKPVVP